MYFPNKLNTWSHLVLLDILFVLIMWYMYIFTNSPFCVFICVESQIYFRVVMHLERLELNFWH